jgi:hypothetical protein
MLGQDTFEQRAKNIASKIETITKEEKAILKIEVEEVNIQVERGTITKEQADLKKQELAQARATIIENKITVVQKELNDLVQQKVDGKLQDIYQPTTFIINYSKAKGVKNEKYQNKIDSINANYSEKRTTSQLVFATGLNNAVTNGSVEKSDFRYLGSHFYEMGITYNTRILDKNNLLHAKYGFSVVRNNLRPTDNRNFVVNGNQTNLELNGMQQEDSRFKNVNLVFPAHLEFDFTKTKEREGKIYFKSHDSFRFGVGGFVGVNLKSKQYINYNSDSYKSRVITKGDFNTSNFIYGLSTYIGYKATSLYLKYDLNPLFKDNAVKQNNVSLGLRFDFN